MSNNEKAGKLKVLVNVTTTTVDTTVREKERLAH